MPRTVQCEKCGVILNLPAQAHAGKRLKCPRCGNRFAISETEASSASTMPGLADATPMSQFDLDRRASIPEDLPVPRSEGDLRDTFNLPLVSGREAEAGSAVAGGGHGVADAASLFQDAGRAKKRVTAADARSQARRCTKCGGVVPRGMSICSTCGTDQETGVRVGLEDDLAPPRPPAPEGPPFHITTIGILCGTAGLILLIMAIIQSTRGESSVEHFAWLALAVVSGFGIFAAVQFIRGKSAKLLIVALTLGVVVDVLALVALPIGQAMLEDQEKILTDINPRDVDDTDKAIKPFEERIDSQKIALGVALILVYAIVSLYLISPPVKRYFQFREFRASQQQVF
jgi:phage FluMu protein Com